MKPNPIDPTSKVNPLSIRNPKTITEREIIDEAIALFGKFGNVTIAGDKLNQQLLNKDEGNILVSVNATCKGTLDDAPPAFSLAFRISSRLLKDVNWEFAHIVIKDVLSGENGEIEIPITKYDSFPPFGGAQIENIPPGVYKFELVYSAPR